MPAAMARSTASQVVDPRRPTEPERRPRHVEPVRRRGAVERRGSRLEAGRSLEVEHERPGAVGLVGHEDRGGRARGSTTRHSRRDPVRGEALLELRAEHVVADTRGELDLRAQAGGGAGEDDGRAARERPVEREGASVG